MTRVLEAVPNISEGRDRAVVRDLLDVVSGFPVEVLDHSSDPDHHRSVFTFIGDPADVEDAAVALVERAAEQIDLRDHRGVHPRVGAVDVVPFVPLHGVTMADAVQSARRVGRRLSAAGVPVWYYGAASDPPGRGLAALRRGGFEGLRDGWPSDRRPDEDGGRSGPHPTAGITCVGARPILLAWNVFLTGVSVEDARGIAASIREIGGGFKGLRALGLRLQGQDRVQVSMNLEDPVATSPLAVFDAIQGAAERLGGQVEETEVIGMLPDTLVLPNSADRLGLSDPSVARVLSHRLSAYLAARGAGNSQTSDTAE
ncbi:MAG: glutamate formimidoyltransferase [Gemmatimonadota bacterium]